MLSFVGTPKAFVEPFATIQRNAICSWKEIDPDGEVLLFGDDEGVAEFAQEIGARHIPEVATTDDGIPLLGDILTQAQELARHDLMAFANADIVLGPELVAATRELLGWRSRFLMTGRRTNMPLDAIDFSGDWSREVRETAHRQGTLHPGTDYFVFPRSLWAEIPPFIIGRESWSCWLLSQARQRGAVVVDATEVVWAIHQEHPYNRSLFKSKDWLTNEDLLGGQHNAFLAPECTHALSPRGIRVRCRGCHPVCVCHFEEP